MEQRRQHAALPFIEVNGKPKVLLITSRDTGRWVIPKGWPERNVTPEKQASVEAWEEAGVKGRISEKKLGSYSYIKRRKRRHDIPCKVSVFALLVKKQYLDWPEKEERVQKWCSPKKAATLVHEKDLATLLRNFDPKALSSTLNNERDSGGKSAP